MVLPLRHGVERVHRRPAVTSRDVDAHHHHAAIEWRRGVPCALRAARGDADLLEHHADGSRHAGEREGHGLRVEDHAQLESRDHRRSAHGLRSVRWDLPRREQSGQFALRGQHAQRSADLWRGTYYARVRAGNSAGSSAYSTEISFRIGAKFRPLKPGGFTGSLQGSVATLSWIAPAGDAEDAPTGYVVEAGSASGLTNLATVPLGNVTSFQAVNVPSGVYYVRVRAVNELGVGVPSDEIVLQPGLGTGQPLNLTSSGQGSMVQLDWQAPSTGDVPTGYLIEAGSGRGLANLAVLRVGNATTFSTTAPPGSTTCACVR